MKIELRNLGNSPKGKLTFIAGRLGMGKTSFALSSHLFYHINNLSSAYLTLENSDQTFERDIIEKFYNMGKHIEYDIPPKYEMPNLHHIAGDFVTSKDVISNFSLIFRDSNVFFIDYFQLLSDNQNFGEREKKLKEIAEAYNIAIVCLSQVDRQLELREDKRPNPKDLESIGIDTSQIDKAIFLYRPSYYNSKDFKHSLESLNMTTEEYSKIYFVHFI